MRPQRQPRPLWLLPGALLLGVGCPPTKVGDSGTEAPDSPADTEQRADSADPLDTTHSAESDDVCDDLTPIPLDADYLEGFTGAEDFAFDGEGYLVSIDQRGNLIGINQAGERKVILANASDFGAGARFLPDGDFVFSDADKGNLIRVNPAEGVPIVVLSGLQYPNGLDVDLDGYVYIAEQGASQVRRIEPSSGADEVIASDLYQPNGVTFSPDYQTMFVGSFGAGVVYAVDRGEDGSWSEPRVYATTPEAPGVPPDWCDTAAPGDACPTNYGYGVGVCTDDGSGDSTCELVLDTAACADLAVGDACTSVLFDRPVDSICTEADDGSGLFCPRTDAENIAACEGIDEYGVCSLEGGGGYCYTSWEGVRACLDTTSYYNAYVEGCVDKAEGDDCVIDDNVFPTVGICGDGTVWGFTDLVCYPGGITYSSHGGLDGINMDECSNLYVTEYTLGKVWRFDAEGAEAELVSRLGASWIPNMHWGNGIGGWETDVLYVMDRDRAGVFALPVGVHGHADAYQPEATQ